MPDWPDIIVVERDIPKVLLAIEVKVGGDLRGAEHQLRTYMVRRNCPAGMLVTPERTVFFRNEYTGYEPETIIRTGECKTAELFASRPNSRIDTETDLFENIGHWLDTLRAGDRQLWPKSAQEVIEADVLPAVIIGVRQATGPRLTRTGS